MNEKSCESATQGGTATNVDNAQDPSPLRIRAVNRLPILATCGQSIPVISTSTEPPIEFVVNVYQITLFVFVQKPGMPAGPVLLPATGCCPQSV